MRDYETGLTQEELKRLLHYNPDTGVFTWKVSVGRVKSGKFAGSKKYRVDGKKHYIAISIGSFLYKAHRLTWLYMTGEWPNIIDHDDRDPFNNKWNNLNNGTSQDNMKNKSIHRNNTSGVNGVNWNNNISKWRAKIDVDCKRVHLGYFKELDAAVAARRSAEKEYGFHPKHGRRSA